MARRASSRDLRRDPRLDRRPLSAPRRRPASAGHERLPTGIRDVAGAPADQDHDDRLLLVSGLHAQKVAALLNSQNKLQCENARLKREDLEHRQAGNRGPAFIRAEAELSRQDAMIRALSDHLSKEKGKEKVRSLIRETLQAGPRRVCPTSRLELRWEVEDVRSELQTVRQETSQREMQMRLLGDAGPSAPHGSRHADGAAADDATLALLAEGSAEATGSASAALAAVKRDIDVMRKRAAALLQENQAQKVETTSLDRILRQGAEQITRLQEAPAPTSSSLIWGPTVTSDRLTMMQQELLDENRTKTDLEKSILKSDHEVQERQFLHDKRVRELAQLKETLARSRRDTSVVFQQQLLEEKKKTSVQQGYVVQAQEKLKELRGYQKTGLLDGKHRIASLSQNIPHREEATRRNAMQEADSQEEAAAALSKELFAEIARIEKQIELDQAMALSDCKAHREEEAVAQQQLKKAQAALQEVAEEHRAAERRHLQRKDFLEGQRIARDSAVSERAFLHDELQDAELRLKNERATCDRKREALDMATEEFRRTLVTRYPRAESPPRQEASKSVADLEAAIRKARSSASSEMARLRKEVDSHREELRAYEEAITTVKAAKADRAAALAETERFNVEQHLKLTAQREREAAARDLTRARSQIQQWLADFESERALFDAASQQQLAVARDFAEAPAQHDQRLSELVDAAAQQRAMEGKDAAVIRAQVERLNASALTEPLEPHQQSPSIAPSSPPADGTASLVDSQGESLVSDVRSLLHMDHDRLIRSAEEASDHDSWIRPAEEAQELEELLTRSAELEDLCLDLEGQRSFLERQVTAAKALIRRQVAGAKLPQAGCPLCEHCQALAYS